MASTGTPTPNIGLNQWLISDNPERADFNSDNQKIDDKLGLIDTELENRATIATPDTIMQRDENGRAQVATPVADSDIATKGYVDENIGGGTAETADRLTTARTVRTNLASTAAANFDGSANITPGVQGTLPVANGGTGNTTGAAASAAILTTARTIRTNLAATAAASFNGSANVTPGVTGILPIANGGTGTNTVTAAAIALGREVMGSYTGNGAVSRLITLGFTPAAVLVTYTYGDITTTDWAKWGLALPGAPAKTPAYSGSSLVVEITANGFNVYARNYDTGESSATNTHFATYNYIAWR